MTDAEKVLAFDNLAVCLVNRWYDGTFSPWGSRLHDLPSRGTFAEAVADLVDWAARHAARGRHRLQLGGTVETPKSLKKSEGAYKPDAWRQWSLLQLAAWVSLLLERAEKHRDPDTEAGRAGAAKDRRDAAAYLDMLAVRLREGAGGS